MLRMPVSQMIYFTLVILVMSLSLNGLAMGLGGDLSQFQGRQSQQNSQWVWGNFLFGNELPLHRGRYSLPCHRISLGTACHLFQNRFGLGCLLPVISSHWLSSLPHWDSQVALSGNLMVGFQDALKVDSLHKNPVVCFTGGALVIKL